MLLLTLRESWNQLPCQTNSILIFIIILLVGYEMLYHRFSPLFSLSVVGIKAYYRDTNLILFVVVTIVVTPVLKETICHNMPYFSTLYTLSALNAPADKKKFNHRVFPPKHAEFMPYFRYFTAPLRIGQKCKMSQNTSKCINQIVVKNRSK